MEWHCCALTKRHQLLHYLHPPSPLTACTSMPCEASGPKRRCGWRAAGDAQEVHPGGAARGEQLCAGHCGGRHRPGGRGAQVPCGEGGLAAALAHVAAPARPADASSSIGNSAVLAGKGGPIAAPSLTTAPAPLTGSPHPSRWASKGVRAHGASAGLAASTSYNVG